VGGERSDATANGEVAADTGHSRAGSKTVRLDPISVRASAERASMRNTGMALEDEVFGMLQSMIDADRLPYKKDRCRIYRRRAYHSPDRGGPVNFENVIEVFRSPDFADDTKPAHVVFYECKDQGRNVEVGEIDEIIARLGVSFGFSMKAYVVTRKGFARGALNTASSKGIGLIKIMPDDKFHVITELLTAQSIAAKYRAFPRRTLRAILDPEYISSDERVYGVDNGYCFTSFEGMLHDHLRSI
jgi:hypothetical protein